MSFNYWNRVIHRDFGYFFFGTTLIYCISGIALNHLKDWNPSYIIRKENYSFPQYIDRKEFSDTDIETILKTVGKSGDYKNHYFPKTSVVRIFVEGGSLEIDLKTGEGYLETVTRRPFFYQVNYLHYNPGKWWLVFSDIFAGALMLIAITGLFIIKGKNSITGRGLWLTLAGILVPIIFLLFF